MSEFSDGDILRCPNTGIALPHCECMLHYMHPPAAEKEIAALTEERAALDADLNECIKDRDDAYARVDAMAKDAARYRWLRNGCNTTDMDSAVHGTDYDSRTTCLLMGYQLDAAIDAYLVPADAEKA